MASEEFWKQMQKMFDKLEEKIEEESSETQKKLGNIKTDQSFHIKEMRKKMAELPEKPTWKRLRENENFRDLSETSQKVIWELAKIEEGDSPKTQAEVADQYGIDKSRVSQLKQKLDSMDL
ncbi:MAG: hypothetical protein ABEJ07_06265 [Candidatus Nanohaloarchaea archaeon]